MNCTAGSIAGVIAIILSFLPGVLAQPAAQYRLGLSFASSIVSNKEQFEFSIGNERVILNSANPVVYFRKTFAPGESYRVTQVSGPRQCDLQGQNTGTFSNADLVISARCGNPPFTLFKLQVSGIESGEVLRFADNYRRTSTRSFSSTSNLGGFPQGDDYIITQTAGPRQCRMILAQGVVPASPVTVQADCARTTPGETPAPAPAPNPTNTFPAFDLVTRNADDKVVGTFYETFTPVIGGKGADEGRYVAYVTYAKGLGGGSGKYRQVVWRDRKTGET
ncbi:MAG: hypothetical protein QUS14_17745, partial [Pyrinomonadaceae bacterium]|nr:hypothetical protein [Pyrinomonadaceae bacterium]